MIRLKLLNMKIGAVLLALAAVFGFGRYVQSNKQEKKNLDDYKETRNDLDNEKRDNNADDAFERLQNRKR